MSQSEPLPYPAIPPDQLIEAMQLLRGEGIGAVTFFRLLQRFGTPVKALEALPDLPKRRPLVAAAREAVEAELSKATTFGAVPVVYGAAHYPSLLAQIYDPPPVLFALGRIELLGRTAMLAMVGSRNASANGSALARRMAADAGTRGLTVVSGLARGIDAAAHWGALAHGTVGVIAGGIDTRYPPENAKLYDAMAKDGLILSEQAFGMAPQARSFPARNRIISGLSQSTLVVEASLRSGSLITARCALDQGRELFAIPGSPIDPRSQGTNSLLKDGAHLTESVDDILNQWPAHAPRRPSELPFAGMREAETETFELTSQVTKIETEISDSGHAQDTRSRVLALLGVSMVSVDELATQCNVPPGPLQALLVELELAGEVLRGPGGRVGLRPAA